MRLSARGHRKDRPAGTWLAAGLLATLLWAIPTPLLAGGCYPQIYYDMLLRPLAQEASGGDSRLVGLSDYLASKGKDPHAKEGSGCMCGVNHGRWDQIFRNTSEQDPGRPPVCFSLLELGLEFFNRKGKPQDCRFRIGPQRLPRCLDGALTTRGFHPYRGGWSKSPGLLEPGENLVGCLCLPPGQRHKSGFVKLKLRYQPLVFSRPLPGPGAQGEMGREGLVIRGNYAIKGLARGQGRYFRLRLPSGLRPDRLVIELAGSRNLVLYTSPAWRPRLADWHRGRLVRKRPGRELWVLVRASADQGRGELRFHLNAPHTSPPPPLPSAGPWPRPVAVGPPGERVFKAYVLGLGSAKAEAKSTPPPHPCCSGR